MAPYRKQMSLPVEATMMAFLDELERDLRHVRAFVRTSHAAGDCLDSLVAVEGELTRLIDKIEQYGIET